MSFFSNSSGATTELPARNHIKDFDFLGINLTIARTGYTGEDGVEVFFPAEDAATIWNEILAKGQAARHSSLRARRARHAAPGNVLSAQRQRSYAGT